MRIRDVARAVGTMLLVGLLAACTQGGATRESPVATSAVDLPPSYRFVPADISIPAGTTITWTNNDHFSHSVKFLDGGLPDEPLMMEPGEAVTFTIEAPGLYHYQCHLHPQNMVGSITVAP
jgi:plastocyanin